ncbi:MAG: DUF2303 family protein [Oceanicaulis sp.]
MNTENHTKDAPDNPLYTGLVAAYAMASYNLVAGEDGRQHVVVPEGFELRDVTDPHRLPGFVRQRVTVDDRGSLIDYATRFKGAQSVLFADIDRGQVIARIDYHELSEAGAGALIAEAGEIIPGRELGGPAHDAHVAVLQLRETEEFRAWSDFCGEFHEQMEFAYFLEENAADVADPDGASLLEIVKDLQTVADHQFKGKVNLDSGDVTLNFETETRQLQPVQLPRKVFLEIPIYDGEPPAQLECALRWRAGGAGALLKLEMRRVARIKRAAFADIAEGVSAGCGLPVFFGRL